MRLKGEQPSMRAHTHTDQRQNDPGRTKEGGKVFTVSTMVLVTFD